MKNFNDLWTILMFLYSEMSLEPTTLPLGDGSIIVTLNCNDIFWWGTADSEEVTIDDIPDLRKSSYDLRGKGLDPDLYCDILWMVRKRKMRPQGAVFSKYPSELRELIIQSAPPREISLFNPYNDYGGYDYE